MFKACNHRAEQRSVYLCPRDGSKGIRRSENRLVVHDRLWGHHGNAPHLMTHLRRELARQKVRAGGSGEGIMCI